MPPPVRSTARVEPKFEGPTRATNGRRRWRCRWRPNHIHPAIPLNQCWINWLIRAIAAMPARWQGSSWLILNVGRCPVRAAANSTDTECPASGAAESTASRPTRCKIEGVLSIIFTLKLRPEGSGFGVWALSSYSRFEIYDLYNYIG